MTMVGELFDDCIDKKALDPSKYTHFVAGIVGHEAAKFTELGKLRATYKIRDILWDTKMAHSIVRVSSGRCHLGGIDIWAEEVAIDEDCFDESLIFPPKVHSWSAGYMPRNIKIARASNEVWSIVVTKLPDDYKGMRHKLCYHCGTDTHVKSGGCWTARYAREKLHKTTHIIEIANY